MILRIFSLQIVVNLTDDLLSRASMTVVNSRPTLTINISTAREQWLEGMLRHEIGACLSVSASDGHIRIVRPIQVFHEPPAPIPCVLYCGSCLGRSVLATACVPAVRDCYTLSVSAQCQHHSNYTPALCVLARVHFLCWSAQKSGVGCWRLDLAIVCNVLVKIC